MDKPRSRFQSPGTLIRQHRKRRASFPVQIAYTGPETSIVLTVNVKPGTTIKEAIAQSHIRKIIGSGKRGEGRIVLSDNSRQPDDKVREDERIELCRQKAAPARKSRKRSPDASA
ncbi:MAG: RnfH family protein [Burkholderiaceae bacterium]|jgi:putative ubiquitin-RnfH superfamily antitoxin RatB of RatAB toxin-antitoxin module|nr:RnfH family protein [Burkholderiaceae bacterium]